VKSNKKTYRPNKEHLQTEEQFSVVFGGCEISRRSASKIHITVPTTVQGLMQVVVNGEVFCKEGSVREVTRIAPVKYQHGHFAEVDEHIDHGYSKKGACEMVAEKYEFNHESFRHQYYTRYANRKV